MGQMIRECLTNERLECYGKLYVAYKECGIDVPDFWLFVEDHAKYIEGDRNLRLVETLETMLKEGYVNDD